jgi:hypothetical protein
MKNVIAENNNNSKNMIKRIRVKIDELVLDGFDDFDYNRLSDAIEQELTLLVSKNRSISPHLINNNNKRVQDYDRSSDIDGAANSFSILQGEASSKTIGSQVARSIYSGLESTD